VTLDQKIQVWNAVGTWLAAIGTIAAVVVALVLSSKPLKVNLKVRVGLRLMILGDGSPGERVLMISATNLAERPATLTTIGWRIGPKDDYKYCVMPRFDRDSSQCPIELAHGKTANFKVTLVTPKYDWCADFGRDFVVNWGDEYLKTLRAQVFTSVEQTVEAVPEESLLKALVEAHRQADYRGV